MKNIILESEWREAPPGVQAEGLQIREWTWPRADPRIFKTKADRADQRRRGGKCSLRAPPPHSARQVVSTPTAKPLLQESEKSLGVKPASDSRWLREAFLSASPATVSNAPCQVCAASWFRDASDNWGESAVWAREDRERKNRHQRKRTVRGREEHVSTSLFCLLRGIRDRISSGLCRRLWKRSESRKGS